MKNFIKKYGAWIITGALLGFGLLMWGVELAKPPTFEFFNKGEIVCFKTAEPKCFKLITIK